MTAWQLDAACSGMAPKFDAWIHGESNDAREQRHREARRICWGECPVRKQCETFRDPAHDFEVMAGYAPTPSKQVPAGGGQGDGPRKRRLPPIAHGRGAGYRTHLRRGEKPCESCRLAQNREWQDNHRKWRTA